MRGIWNWLIQFLILSIRIHFIPFLICFFLFYALGNHGQQMGNPYILINWQHRHNAQKLQRHPSAEYADQITALLMGRTRAFVCQREEMASTLIPIYLLLSSVPCYLWTVLSVATPLCPPYSPLPCVGMMYSAAGTLMTKNNPLHLERGTLNPNLKPPNHSIYWSV